MTGDAEKWVYRFGNGEAEAGIGERGVVGGKGASLCEMSRAGLPVPPGLVLPTACCRHVLAHQGAWPDGLEEQLRDAVAWLEKTTGKAFDASDHGLLLAVRSGAAESMPGMMDTLLDVGRHSAAEGRAGTGPWDALREAIDAVFRSWNSDRAVAYRRERRLPDTPGTAVTVQAMFPSAVSGVLFTRDPAGAGEEYMVVEAHTGLGDAVVSGAVTPHRARVSRHPPFEARWVRAESDHDASPLSGGQLARLAALALEVEQRFGAPMDIEWGWADGAFALLQCRPIRGLDVALDVEVGRAAEVARLRTAAGDRRTVWVVHNLAETLPHPTPMTWDIVRRFMSGSGGFGLLYRDLGYRPSRRVLEEGFLDLICGTPYADPERQAELFWGQFPLTYEPTALRQDPSLLQGLPLHLDVGRAGPWFLCKLPFFVLRLCVGAWRSRRWQRRAVSVFEASLPSFLSYVESARRLDLSRFSVPELVAELDDRRQRVLDDFGRHCLKPGFFAALALKSLEQRLELVLGPGEGRSLAGLLAGGHQDGLAKAQARWFRRLAAGETTIELFFRDFGHRAIGEMELARPRWREDASYVEGFIKPFGQAAPGTLGAGNPEAKGEREEAEAALADRLARAGASSFEQEIRELVRTTRRLLPYRETGRHYLMMGYELLRLVLLELGRRTRMGEGVFFLHLDELSRLEHDSSGPHTVAEERRVRWLSAQRLELASVVDSVDLERLGLPLPAATGALLTGTPLAPGVARGTARVLTDPRGAAPPAVGSILVCPSTDPAWAPVLFHVAGLVTERGGALSHGAIVARELGIPAVAVPGAIAAIADGERIRVDGSRGLLERIGPAVRAHGGDG